MPRSSKGLGPGLGFKSLVVGRVLPVLARLCRLGSNCKSPQCGLNRVLLAKTYFISVMQYNQPRWDRWSEYAFSSSAMIIIIAGTAGVNYAFLLWTLSTAQFAMLMFGLAIEALDYSRAYVEPYYGMASQALLGSVSVSSEIPGENQQLSISSIKMPWKIADKQLPASMLGKKKQHMESGAVVGERVPLMSVPLGTPFFPTVEGYKKVIQWVKLSIFITASWIYVWIWVTIWYTFSSVKNKLLHERRVQDGGLRHPRVDHHYRILPVWILRGSSGPVCLQTDACRLDGPPDLRACLVLRVRLRAAEPLVQDDPRLPSPMGGQDHEVQLKIVYCSLVYSGQVGYGEVGDVLIQRLLQ